MDDLAFQQAVAKLFPGERPFRITMQGITGLAIGRDIYEAKARFMAANQIEEPEEEPETSMDKAYRIADRVRESRED